MRIYMAGLAIILLALGTGAAWAYPTMGGATGLVTLPTAEVVPTGTVDLAADYQKLDIGTKALGGALQMYDSALPIRAVAGIMDGIEIWGGYNLIENSSDLKIWNIGGKYLLKRKMLGDTSVAVGGSYGKWRSDDIDMKSASAFVVMSQDLAMGDAAGISNTKAHIGMMWIRMGYPISERLLRPFVGLEFTGENGSSLAVEYRIKDSAIDEDSPFSAVLRFPLAEASPLSVEVGTTNAALGGVGTDDNHFFYGLCYRLGGVMQSVPGTRTRSWGY